MSNLAIRVEKLSKHYRIGGQRERYATLRDKVMDALASPLRRAGKLLRGEATGAAELDATIWALKNISFNIKQGEVVGIIGPNGAGKSTLLKILTRITEPTEGSAFIRGRTGSLLEVGTGFHPELTGRENVYLYGAILGMTKAEIEHKFDEIIAFAETEKFVDTPVKHYSSGMTVRLAFAVAAHLEPEVLIVDEVLAVGDARFQQKCLNKMQDVSQQGRTVLFVSHNMQAVARLCDRAILLDRGEVVEDGPSQHVVSTYLTSEFSVTSSRQWPDPLTAPGGEVARLYAVRVCTEDGYITDAVDIRQPVIIEMEYDVLKSGYLLLPHFGFWNEEGVCAFVSLDLDPAWKLRPRPVGHYLSTARVPGNFLSEGTIWISANLHTTDPFIHQFNVRDAVAFHVIDSLDGDSARGNYTGRLLGVVRPILQWHTHYDPSAPEAETSFPHPCKGTIK